MFELHLRAAIFKKGKKKNFLNDFLIIFFQILKGYIKYNLGKKILKKIKHILRK